MLLGPRPKKQPIVEELWKSISEFPDYEISNKGRVRRIQKAVYLSVDDTVVLTQNGKKHHRSIKKLIELAFQTP